MAVHVFMARERLESFRTSVIGMTVTDHDLSGWLGHCQGKLLIIPFMRISQLGCVCKSVCTETEQCNTFLKTLLCGSESGKDNGFMAPNRVCCSRPVFAHALPSAGESTRQLVFLTTEYTNCSTCSCRIHPRIVFKASMRL